MRVEISSGPVALEGSSFCKISATSSTVHNRSWLHLLGSDGMESESSGISQLLKHTEKKSFSVSALTIIESATKSLCFNIGKELSDLFIDLSVLQNFFESFIFEESLLKKEALALCSCLVATRAYKRGRGQHRTYTAKQQLPYRLRTPRIHNACKRMVKLVRYRYITQRAQCAESKFSISCVLI